MATPQFAARPIPANPNLEFDRKQAKALLDAARRGEATAAQRFKANHPRFSSDFDVQAVALCDAQLVVAREYGFANWPRWKQFVELRRLDSSQRAAALVKAACSNDVRKAALLLGSEPALARHDIATACACGESEAVAQFIAREPSLANTKVGPLNIEPILYCCFSRFLRADANRAQGIVASVRSLLNAGADANASFIADSGGEKWLQSTLYGTAGIANHLELTTILLDSGATIHADDKEVLYHSSEFPDPTCLQLILTRGKPSVEQVKYCLGRALDFEYPKHVELFLAAGADPNYRIPWSGRRTHLHKAVYSDRSVGIVRMLLDAGGDVQASDDRGISVLRSAVRNGNREIVNLLKSLGVIDESITEIDARQGDPMTLCLAAGRDDVATIDRLLDGGADVNAVAGGDGMPPLHCAAWRGRFNATRRLAERGADIHRVNQYGGAALGTAIHGSANCYDTEGGPGMKLHDEAVNGQYVEIIEFLIARGGCLPDRIRGGSDAVQDVLRRHGVPDANSDQL
jgi:ankyrin repeat protein